MEVINFSSDSLRGEIAALTAAFLWAVSSVIYGILGQKISPLQLNLFKGIVAIALIAITLLLKGELFTQLKLLPIALLLLSGVIGIGLGDTAYFTALNSLGARQTLLISTLSPPMSALLALIFLGELLGANAWYGIVITICGVAWVISERTPNLSASISSGRGIIWAILAALSNAIGAVLSRYALIESDISPLWSTLLRLIGGTLIVVLLLFFSGDLHNKLQQPLASVKIVGVIVLTATGSTYLGIWLQQTALKFSATGIAQTLLATSPLFVIPLAAWMGEKISLRAILGVLVAIVGIGLLFSFN